MVHNDSQSAEAIDEMLDIVDASYHTIGTKRREDVHRDGDLHYVIHCWVIIPSTQEMILQKRAPEKNYGGGLYDVSCAGHYSAGEEMTSTRELYEEMGIRVSYDVLTQLFEFEDHFEYGIYHDNEIARVHVLKWDTAYIQTNVSHEVSGFARCQLADFLGLIHGDLQKIRIINERGEAQYIEYKDFAKRDLLYYTKLYEALRDDLQRES